MDNSVFNFNDYRSFLKRVIAQKDGTGRGFRSHLADQIGCQRTFISQVLAGVAEFNLEHGEAVGVALHMTDDEIDFFLLLISFSRAGTQRLKERMRKQIGNIREKRNVLKNRFQENDKLSLEDKLEYYSSWLYGAIRVLVTIPEFQDREALENYFNVPKEQISTAIEFLVSRNLIRSEKTKLSPSERHMYLGNDTKLVIKHHMNWRMKAIESLEREKKTDLHFSAVNSLSREDASKIREKMASFLEEIRNTVKDSNAECLYTICLDFFETT